MDENHKKLAEMDSKLDKVLQWQAGMDERCKAHRNRTDELHSTVYGNPGHQDGLDHQVSRLVNCKTNIGRWRDFWIYVLKVLTVCGIIGVVSWFINFYKSH